MQTNAQTTQLATWDFASSNTTPTLAQGIGSATIATSGNLQTSTSFTNSYSVTNLSATTLAQAKNGNGTLPAQYISVTISPNPNFAIDISNVVVQGFSQNRNRTFNLSYIDAQSNLVNVSNKTITTPTQTQTFTLSSLTGIQTPIELRFYIFSNPADVFEAAGFGEATGLDLVINGKITNTTTNPILPGMWSLQGNTVAGTQFLGSVNNEAVKIYTNNSEKVRITADGNVGIGTPNPTQRLSVAGNINLTGTGTGLIFDDGTFINSASKINQAVVNGQTSDVSLSGLNVQNLTVSSDLSVNNVKVNGVFNAQNAIGNFQAINTGFINAYGNISTIGNITAGTIQIQSNGGGGILSSPTISRYGSHGGILINGPTSGIGLYVSPSNKVSIGAISTGYNDPELSITGDARISGILTTTGAKITNATITTIKFADGTVQTTAGLGSITQPVTYNNSSNYYTYQGNINIPGTLKLGTNSLYLSGSNAGSSNEIYSDGSELKIQSNPAFNFNTIINSGNTGKVGIGTANPQAKLHVGGNIIVDGKLEVRDRIDIGRDDNNPLIRIGSLVMQDFSDFSYSVVTTGQGTAGQSTLFTVSQIPEAFVFGNIFFDEVTQTYKSIFNGSSSTYYTSPSSSSNGISGSARTNGGTAMRFSSTDGSLEFISIPNASSQSSQGSVQPSGFSLTKQQLLNKRRLMISDAGVTVNGNNFIIGQDNGIVFADGTKISSLSEIIAQNYWTKSGTNLFYNIGNVGIGTTSPTAKLDVNGSVKMTGVVQIGTTPPTGTNYQLGVDGNVRVKGTMAAYTVVANATATPDFVFEKDYTLPSLQETKDYVKTNKHLPYIKSAKELEVSGINMTEHTNGMLRHIEEMYLHIITLEEKIKELEKRK